MGPFPSALGPESAVALELLAFTGLSRWGSGLVGLVLALLQHYPAGSAA